MSVPGMFDKDAFEWNAPADRLKEALARHRHWIATTYPDALSERDDYLDRLGVAWRHERFADAEPPSFREARFIGVDLSGAILFNADLSGVNLNGANLSKANLNGAILRGADLTAANLRSAGLIGADLRGASLDGADLAGAKLMTADLAGANLRSADLSDADLSDVSLREANLDFADLTNATLFHANLGSAHLTGTKLKNTRLANANFTDAVYAPTSDAPSTDVVGILGLSRLRLAFGNEVGLVLLRKFLQDAGLRDLEREATYSIERSRTLGYFRNKNIDTPRILEAAFRTVAFDWTTSYAKNPGRALLLIIIVGLLCVPFYWWSIDRDPGPVGSSGIYQVLPKDRVGGTAAIPVITRDGKVVRVHEKGLAAIAAATYFSLLSGANVGFNQFTPGDWIRRLQPQEYTFEAVGWVRTVAGIQALLTLYLLAICVLTYFGRPFQ